MAYVRPSLETLISRIKGDLSSRTKGSAFIQASVELVLSIVLGGIAHGIHAHLDWLREQISPLTCDIDMLLVWGGLVRVPRKAANEATGFAVFPGTNGSVLPVDSEMKALNGTLFKTTAAATVENGFTQPPIVGLGARSRGNHDAGATLVLVSAPLGIESTGAVGSGGLARGAEIEAVERYRARVLAELRKPAKGGGPGDYEKWALENPGVTRAWEYGARMGAGTVSVGFVMDGRPNIIPLAADVEAVYQYINARRPIDMRALYVQPPVAVPVNITIALRPNTAAVRAAVTTEVTDLIKSTANLETEMPQSEIDEAISIAEGEVAHEITAISNFDPGPWGLLVPGVLTFTEMV